MLYIFVYDCVLPQYNLAGLSTNSMMVKTGTLKYDSRYDSEDYGNRLSTKYIWMNKIIYVWLVTHQMDMVCPHNFSMVVSISLVHDIRILGQLNLVSGIRLLSYKHYCANGICWKMYVGSYLHNTFIILRSLSNRWLGTLHDIRNDTRSTFFDIWIRLFSYLHILDT